MTNACMFMSNRTIMALWKAKSTASTDQKIQMADHESDHNSNQIQTSPAQMQEVFSSSCTIPVMPVSPREIPSLPL